MTLRLTEEQEAALARLAERWGVSTQVAALRAIEKTDVREQDLAEVEAAGRRSLERWGGVYQALAET
jgi:Zn-dependent peptidase ImmA (M78 family)